MKTPEEYFIDTESVFHVGHVKALRLAVREAVEEFHKQVDSSTGPTGGWLDSPKALIAANSDHFKKAGY